MTFKDMNSWWPRQESYSTSDIYKEWKALKKEEPENHAETFAEEMLNIIEATIYEQNDLYISDRTPKEVKKLITRLRNKIFG